MPSTINTLKPAPAAAGESGSPSPGTPLLGKPAISRTPSTTTVTQSRQLAGSGGKQHFQRAFRTSSGSQRRPTVASRPTSMAQYEGDEYALGHDGPSDSASEDEPPSRSQAFRRPALGKRPALRKLSSDGDAEDDGDDSSNGYLPFAAGTASTTKQDIHHQESATTLKSSPKRQTARPAFQPHQTLNKGKSKAPLPPPSSSEEDPSSSATSSSAAHPPASSRFELAQDRSSGPMNPAHRAHLASLSPRARQAAALSDASPSEGGRSMGSSFSDLEDDSITRSAMESALAEHLRDHGSLTQGVGSIASRMGSMGRNLGSGFGGGGRR